MLTNAHAVRSSDVRTLATDPTVAGFVLVRVIHHLLVAHAATTLCPPIADEGRAILRHGHIWGGGMI